MTWNQKQQNGQNKNKNVKEQRHNQIYIVANI